MSDSDATPAEVSLQVIGAGLMRTGTHTLRTAIERLLGPRCYHMRSVVEQPSDIDFWTKACSASPSDSEWKEFLHGHTGAVDYPPCVFYKRLMEVYPRAKVVLTVRDPDAWFRSVGNTIHAHMQTMKSKLKEDDGHMSRFPEMLDLLFSKTFGQDFDLADEKRMLAAWEQWTTEVKATVPADRLLVFDVREGWEPLCKFLGVSVPDEPFPVTNTTDDFLKRAAAKYDK